MLLCPSDVWNSVSERQKWGSSSTKDGTKWSTELWSDGIDRARCCYLSWTLHKIVFLPKSKQNITLFHVVMEGSGAEEKYILITVANHPFSIFNFLWPFHFYAVNLYSFMVSLCVRLCSISFLTSSQMHRSIIPSHPGDADFILINCIDDFLDRKIETTWKENARYPVIFQACFYVGIVSGSLLCQLWLMW